MEEIQMNIPIEEALESSEAFLIRPFVGLTALRNGYHFGKRNNGLWRLFMDANVKNFTAEVTGITKNK